MIGESPYHNEIDEVISRLKGRPAIREIIKIAVRYQGDGKPKSCRRLKGADGKLYPTCDDPECPEHTRHYRLTLRSAQRLVDYLPKELAVVYLRLDTRWQVKAWSCRKKA